MMGVVAIGVCGACVAEEAQRGIQVEAVDFVEKTIYHSPETPGYTSWVGLWQLPNGTVCCDFRQVTGPKDNPVSSVPVLGARDGGQLPPANVTQPFKSDVLNGRRKPWAVDGAIAFRRTNRSSP